jgi:hypothetical protein
MDLLYIGNIVGSDVYVCGTLVDRNTTNIAKYWKNGIEVSLSMP